VNEPAGGLAKDEETGLYYYGARYYDAKTSVWQSVDPLAEKYPSFSPYCYTLNNPINYIDPDGRDVIMGLTGERLEAYRKFVSTEVGRNFVAQFLKAGDVIPETSIKVNKTGKYSKETLMFRSFSKNVNKGNTQFFLKNEGGGYQSLNKVYDERSLSKWTSNYLFALNLEETNQIKSDELTVVIGHESFVHILETLKNIDEIREGIKNGSIKTTLDYINKIRRLDDNEDIDHSKLKADEIKLFKILVDELDKKENTTKYNKIYQENKNAQH